MKRSTKAALLSALVLPGAGHIFLKRYISGLILAAVSLAGLYYLSSKAIESALLIAEKIQTGTLPPDAETIMALASKQPIGAEPLLLNIAAAAFIIAWLIGIVDSYRIGYLQEKGSALMNQ